MQTAIKYSVILPTYNRAKSLSEGLQALARQTVSCSDYEVIIVDDGSTAETKDIVTQFSNTHPHVVLRYERLSRNSGCAKARNQGILKAKGEVLLFTDDDCIVPPTWIQVHGETHARYPEAAGVGGWYFPADDLMQRNIFHQFYDVQFDFAFPQQRNFEIHTNTMRTAAGNTANMSYKRIVFEKNGVFDEVLYFTGGVDWEFKARLIAHGLSLVFVPLVVEHRKELSLSTFVKKTILLGRGHAYRTRKYAPSDLIGLPIPHSLSGALFSYAKWGTYIPRRRAYAHLFALWLSCFLIGKYLNYILGFYPKGEPFRTSVQTTFFRKYDKQGNVVVKEEVQKLPALRQFTHNMITQSEVSPPRYSIIIPTFNRAPFLPHVLHSLVSQSIPLSCYEIIIVDDGSTDETAGVVHEIQAQNSDAQIKYLYQNNGGPAAARNRGAEIARGSILFFVDSDCVVHRDVMRVHLSLYAQSEEIAAVGGGMLTTHTSARVFNRIRHGSFPNAFITQNPDKILITNDVSFKVAPHNGGNLSVKSEVFKKCGRFLAPDNVRGKTANEDVALCFRIQKEGHVMALVPYYAENLRLISFLEFRKMTLTEGRFHHFILQTLNPIPLNLDYRPSRVLVGAACIRALVRPTRLHFVSILQQYYRYQGFRSRDMEHIDK